MPFSTEVLMSKPALPTSLDFAMTEPKIVSYPVMPGSDAGCDCGCGVGIGADGGMMQEEDAQRLRQRAEALLAALGRARDETREQLAVFNRADAMEAVLGRSAIDAAIEKTRQSLRRFDEALLRRNDADPRHPSAAS